MKKVEQVDLDGNIFLDYDTSLSPSALFNVIFRSFPAIFKDEDGMICGELAGKGYAIRVKNITYLGHPHPLFKKRIQIANDLQEFYRRAHEKKRTPILLGVYTCGENTLFCDFNIEDFIEKKAHNSSAHVYSSDLSEATIEGYFYKEDYFGNKITVFNASAVEAVLREKLGLLENANSQEYETDQGYTERLVAEPSVPYGYDEEVSRVEQIVMDFFATTEKRWHGIQCYQAMISANYRNKFQPEWPGFFLEYQFERYLAYHSLTNNIRYAQDKKKGGIDLDLFFPKLNMYGDLKAHSSNSNAIQGNDWNTILTIINEPAQWNHIYYIVCEHETEKDMDHDFEVTYFWNTEQGKDNLLSYSKRMKNNVQLTRAYIFDINATNQQFLTKFRQGLNSNGKPREPKIMIEHDNFSHFVLAESEL